MALPKIVYKLFKKEALNNTKTAIIGAVESGSTSRYQLPKKDEERKKQLAENYLEKTRSKIDYDRIEKQITDDSRLSGRKERLALAALEVVRIEDSAEGQINRKRANTYQKLNVDAEGLVSDRETDTLIAYVQGVEDIKKSSEERRESVFKDLKRAGYDKGKARDLIDDMAWRFRYGKSTEALESLANNNTSYKK